MSDNVAAIVEFLHSKGLSAAQVAGVLGNMRVESDFSPTAYNANEGAIGLCQWEGGRRTALQQFAAAHGGSERDLDMQLGYLWHELQTGEHGAYVALMNAHTATDAAVAWDSQFERSDGTTRGERIGYADHFAQTLAREGLPTVGPAPDTAGTAPLTGSDFPDDAPVSGYFVPTPAVPGYFVPSEPIPGYPTGVPGGAVAGDPAVGDPVPGDPSGSTAGSTDVAGTGISTGYSPPPGLTIAELQQRYQAELTHWAQVMGKPVSTEADALGDLAAGPTSSPPPPSAAGPNDAALQRFLHAAVAQRGDPYVFGAKGTAAPGQPRTFDCSGLTAWASQQAGITLPAGAAHQYIALKQAGTVIPVKEAMHTPGALLFHFAAEPQPGDGEPPVAHVAISLGNGKTIEAADPQLGVTELHAQGRFEYAAIIPGIGTETAPRNHQVIEYAPGHAPHVQHEVGVESVDALEGHGHLASSGHHGHDLGSGSFDDPFGHVSGLLPDDGLGGSGWDPGH